MLLPGFEPKRAIALMPAHLKVSSHHGNKPFWKKILPEGADCGVPFKVPLRELLKIRDAPGPTATTAIFEYPWMSHQSPFYTVEHGAKNNKSKIQLVIGNEKCARSFFAQTF